MSISSPFPFSSATVVALAGKGGGREMATEDTETQREGKRRGEREDKKDFVPFWYPPSFLSHF